MGDTKNNMKVASKPNGKKFKIDTDQDELVVFCREPPVKGKSNRELIKELSKVFDKESRDPLL